MTDCQTCDDEGVVDADDPTGCFFGVLRETCPDCLDEVCLACRGPLTEGRCAWRACDGFGQNIGREVSQ